MGKKKSQKLQLGVWEKWKKNTQTGDKIALGERMSRTSENLIKAMYHETSITCLCDNILGEKSLRFFTNTQRLQTLGPYFIKGCWMGGF